MTKVKKQPADPSSSPRIPPSPLRVALVGPLILYFGGVALHFSILVFAAAHDTVMGSRFSLFMQEYTASMLFWSLVVGTVVWFPVIIFSVMAHKTYMDRYGRRLT